MKSIPIISLLLICLSLKGLAAEPEAGGEEKIPGFKNPTPGVSRKIDMPLVDLSADKKRHSVVAAGTESVYQGHCDTVLLPDGKTMFTAWCLGHARWIGPLAKSTDAGRTWSEPLKVPENWHKTSNTPALHRLVGPDGKARLFCFADGLDWSRQGKPPYPMHQSWSEDEGETWNPMVPNGVEGEVPPKTILTFDEGKRLVMWSDLPGYVVQSESLDGGVSWSASQRILRVPDRWSQPCVIRSTDGKTLLMLLRENSRKNQSLFSVSYDNAKSWSEAKELPASLTGDRHVAKFTPDGRVLVAFRDMANSSPTYGHYLAWVGSFENILAGKPGDYRVKLFHNAQRKESDKPGQGNSDCGYSDLEVLPDGTVIATTYLKYAEGPEKHSVMNTRFTLEETDALAGEHSDLQSKEAALIPAGWDAALAGDQVLQRLVRVSAPQVKGAHDAEFVCVGDRAYIVEHDNDVQPGHGAGHRMYCVLSIVNLKTLKIEKTIPLAKSEQVFENVTLPIGACFVPRILKLNEQTLRCYFASEDGANREAQTWYRDFDLRSQIFAGGIHKVKIKTTAGVFDMQPQHFYADAALQGFTKPAKAFGLYLFDSFKQFDGKTYVAINNWPGKQNALALMHEDGVTFEVIGHFNEPQSQQLSEAAVNRLPDGTWMAICRNDGGNYYFTTSVDGKKWSVASEMPFVSNGLNSKPTFDVFGGVYYLGWQEATLIGGCNRSVFNVDISSDGKRWERKYRFETPESFQYPAFHEHDGAVWLSVSQSDHLGSTDRIMFGKLEELGRFETQSGKGRIVWPVKTAESAVMKQGVKLFTDRDYVIREVPDALKGLSFLRNSIDDFHVRIAQGGVIYALTPPENIEGAASQGTEPDESSRFERSRGLREETCTRFSFFGSLATDLVDG